MCSLLFHLIKRVHQLPFHTIVNGLHRITNAYILLNKIKKYPKIFTIMCVLLDPL